MSEHMAQLIAGVRAAITRCEAVIDEAYYEVPRVQVYEYTKYYRRLLKAQVSLLVEFGGSKHGRLS